MAVFSYPNFKTQHGYMTKTAQTGYVGNAMDAGLLPSDTMRRADLVTLNAPNDPSQLIRFWQLFSVLCPDLIVAIVESFYEHVFADEPWFTSVFKRVGGVEHLTMTPVSMWADVMGVARIITVLTFV